eukprot:m.42285 g.42285  ORF g.42285 m.42285 type:complete len:86 (-) comp10669_c0_seq3:82-339(-)
MANLFEKHAYCVTNCRRGRSYVNNETVSLVTLSPGPVTLESTQIHGFITLCHGVYVCGSGCSLWLCRTSTPMVNLLCDNDLLRFK